MICKHCKKEINRVNAYSECWQKCELEGNKITDWGSVEEVLETVGIECPECGGDLSKEVEE